MREPLPTEQPSRVRSFGMALVDTDDNDAFVIVAEIGGEPVMFRGACRLEALLKLQRFVVTGGRP